MFVDMSHRSGVEALSHHTAWVTGFLEVILDLY